MHPGRVKAHWRGIDAVWLGPSLCFCEDRSYSILVMSIYYYYFKEPNQHSRTNEKSLSIPLQLLFV